MIGVQDPYQNRRIEALDTAANEALRFVEKVEAAIADLKTKSCIDTSPAFASAKRSSMDLTRALASVRRNGLGDLK
jgi:hypothetical protein